MTTVTDSCPRIRKLRRMDCGTDGTLMEVMQKVITLSAITLERKLRSGLTATMTVSRVPHAAILGRSLNRRLDLREGYSSRESWNSRGDSSDAATDG